MKLTIQTKGHNDFIDITNQVTEVVQKSGITDGVVVIFLPGSTAAITTMEYESGIIEDMTELFEKYIPEDKNYKHHQRWGDHNGAAHIKAALIKPDLTVLITNGQLQLGTWQQIVLICFDERPRDREVIVKIF